MRHVVLFEPDPSGHRMPFIRYIVEAMARHGGMRATLVTSFRAQAAPWVAAMREDLCEHLSLFTIDSPNQAAALSRVHPKLGRQFGYTRLLQAAVRDLARDTGVDHVLVPFVDDYCLFPFALDRRPFGPVPWSGIAIRPRFHLRDMGAIVPRRFEDQIESVGYRQLLRSPKLHSLFSIDPYLAPYLADPRVMTVHDPADIGDQTPDRAWLPVADDAIVLLVYGYIDRRKAIDRLIKIAADPRLPKSLVIALVGMQDDEMTAVLENAAGKNLREEGRLVEVPRHVSESEEASAFARADIVWGYYPGSYCSSGAMVRAGQSARPLMAGEEGLVGHLTERNGSGLMAPEYDDEALTLQLIRLTEDGDLRNALGEAGRRHFANATGMAFGDRIVRQIAADPHHATSSPS